MEEKEDFWGEVESSQNEAIPSVMISGEPQTVTATQQMYGAQQQMILIQQPSSAPKIIGVLMIIASIFTLLSAFTMSGAASDPTRWRHRQADKEDPAMFIVTAYRLR